MANQSRMNDWLSRLRRGGEAGLGGEDVIITNSFAFPSRQDAIRYYEREYGGPVAERNGRFFDARSGARGGISGRAVPHDPPSSSGYVDLNITYGTPYFIGLTGGVMISEQNVSPYVGGGAVTPGVGGGVSYSPDAVSGGAGIGRPGFGGKHVPRIRGFEAWSFCYYLLRI